jgi:hypothetical protein
MTTIEHILEKNPALVPYTGLPKNGIHINTHNKLVKISPANYTKEVLVAGATHDEIYEAILKGKEESYKKFLTKVGLPLGKDTHDISFVPQVGNSDKSTDKIVIVLDLSKSRVRLDVFQELIEKYKQTKFSLGRVPYHSPSVFQGMLQVCGQNYPTKITNIFPRKRDNKTRIKVGIAFSPIIFGLENQNILDLD